MDIQVWYNATEFMNDVPAKMEEMLKMPSQFVMIGKSYVVNVQHIKAYYNNKILMDNGHILNVSRDYKKMVDNRIKNLIRTTE